MLCVLRSSDCWMMPTMRQHGNQRRLLLTRNWAVHQAQQWHKLFWAWLIPFQCTCDNLYTCAITYIKIYCVNASAVMKLTVLDKHDTVFDENHLYDINNAITQICFVFSKCPFYFSLEWCSNVNIKHGDVITCQRLPCPFWGESTGQRCISPRRTSNVEFLYLVFHCA